MFKYYFTILLCAFAYYSLNAQCPPGDVTLSSQAEVDDFVATYPNCTEILGNMEIGSLSGTTDDITNISGLGSLTSIGGNLEVANNDVLMSLTGLDQLTSIGGDLVIVSNNVLTSLTGLENLTSIIGDLYIGSNNASFTEGLTSLTGLGQLTSIGGDLDINGHNVLTSLTGLDQLTSVGGNLVIGDNNVLTSLTGLGKLTSVGGFLSIFRNDVLTSLTGLGQLTSVGETLAIGDNAGLTSLTGLDSLTSIGEDLSIFRNDVLTSVTGLGQLTSIGGDLDINNNAVLTSLTGLENLNATTINNLIIVNNPELSDCAIESVCDYLGVAVNTATISGNARGCTTREEVETACIVSTTDISQANIELFPNPTNGMLQLRNSTAEEVIVYTTQGQRIARYDSPGQELDLSALPAGVYHLHLIAADAAYAARVVKQ